MEAKGPDVRAGSIAEALAKAQVHAPTRGNRRLERFLDAVNADERVRAWWYMAQINSERLGLAAQVAQCSLRAFFHHFA